MHYEQAEKFIFKCAKKTRVEYMKNKASADFFLMRLQFLLNLIDNPEKNIPNFIHIAGTSGKGSTALMMARILQENGKQTGILTSPEPGKLQSRIAINQRKISKKQFADIITKIAPALLECEKKSPYGMPSFYEIITAVALKYFALKKIPFVVLETGCGGRLDSTNIIPHKKIAIITNIGLDHTDILGKTKNKIAREKAGIITNADLVITGTSDKKSLDVIKKRCVNKKIKLNIVSHPKLKIAWKKNGMEFDYQNTHFTLNTLGEHQIQNALVVINASKALKIPTKKIQTGLKKTKLPMRFEIISRSPLVILDSAHNPDKITATVLAYQKYAPKTKNLSLLTGFTKGKDISSMVKKLSVLKPNTIYLSPYQKKNFREAQNPNLIAKLFKKSLKLAKIFTYTNSLTAYKQARKNLKKDDCLLITGSSYLAGEIKLSNLS